MLRHDCAKINKEDNCPICLNLIYDQKHEAVMLMCNHVIHKKCLDELTNSMLQNKKIPCCTVCKKTTTNPLRYEDKYDKYIKDAPMPEYYKNWKTDILCNDCCEKTTVKYHMDYHKCAKCRSYNTSKVNVIKNND